MYDPEHNIAAAARYIKELQNTFSDIKDRHEQQDFILAAYNGGAHHIRDAMALAKREGRNDHSWKEVSVFVLRLSQPQYYCDSLVKNGYMRGSETVDYVRLIRERYQMYRGAARPHNGSSVPQKSQNARHRKKYKL
jgi:membrane-bound lytic murein transglycosylase F